MQQTHLSSMPQESSNRLDLIPSCTELPSGIKLPLDWMEVVDDVEDVLKDETNFMALVSFHLLKLNVIEMWNYDHF